MFKIATQKLARRLLILLVLGGGLIILTLPPMTKGNDSALPARLLEVSTCAECDAQHDDCQSQNTIQTDECLQPADATYDQCTSDKLAEYYACLDQCNSDPASPDGCGTTCDDNAQKGYHLC